MGIGLIIFGFGMLTTAAFLPYFSSFKKTNYRLRMVFYIWINLFLLIANYFIYTPTIHTVMLGIALGVMLILPAILWRRQWFNKRISKDNVIQYTSPDNKKALLKSAPLLVSSCCILFLDFEVLQQLFFILLAFSQASMVSCLSEIGYITYLERSKGIQITETMIKSPAKKSPVLVQLEFPAVTRTRPTAISLSKLVRLYWESAPKKGFQPSPSP